MTTYAYYVAAAVVVLMIVGVFIWRRVQSPSSAIWNGISEAVPQLQRRALRNILPSQTALPPQRMAAQTKRVADTIRLIYTVEQHERGFLHTASSQLLRRKSRKYHLQCAAVVMLVLQKQLGNFAITDEDVAFNVDQSDLGTLFVYMLVSPAGHERFLEQAKLSA